VDCPDGAGTDLEAATRAALSEASVYEARERLFIDATTAVAGAGQAMFEWLRALQRVVAAGAAQDSRAFHDAYHPYIEAVWKYRVAVRGELEDSSLSPATFGWEEWGGRDRCPSCGGPVAAAAPTESETGARRTARCLTVGRRTARAA
jgi:hypothetical protein